MIIMYMVCLPMYLGIGTLARSVLTPHQGRGIDRGNKNLGGGERDRRQLVRNIYACSGVLSWSENTRNSIHQYINF